MSTETNTVLGCNCGLAIFAPSAVDAYTDHYMHYLDSGGGEGHLVTHEMAISNPINNIHSVCRIMKAERRFENAREQVERRKVFADSFPGTPDDPYPRYERICPGHSESSGVTEDGLEDAVGLWSASRVWLGFVIIAVVCWSIWRVL
jgi:hypothetical protein